MEPSCREPGIQTHGGPDQEKPSGLAPRTALRVALVLEADQPSMDRARQLAPVLAELMASGMSARQMAVELTARGIPTATGARWHTQTVLRMIDRVGC